MGFSAAWLALREPADHAARDAALLAAAAKAAGQPAVIVDLGCGTGSTIRAFAGHLADGATWRLVDNDPELLRHAAAATQGVVTTHRIDLRDLESLPLDGASLVTASALLDLCSLDWVERLAARLADHRLPFYAALTYDGDMHWTPSDPADAAVTRAFNRHQVGDKGFGPALGPGATDAMAAALQRRGYALRRADSPWQLGPAQSALQIELLGGIATAAEEAGEELAKAWGGTRAAAAQTALCHIGHTDLLALPPDAP
ncbi:class I SAM-dependent methyltransferase [Seohaeicola saemankumensis]|uniref:Class I SAM-dependent methyltransferase n=1 Tax=Seohaeicola saemankumensis TaxID=481181 RepID=A0ABW3TEB7_9RHOB